MYRPNKLANKNSQTKWDNYELYGSEPQFRKGYDISPELEAELLDNSYFLKRRVWRQMKWLQKHTSRPLHFSHFAKPQTKKTSAFHHKPAHSF